MKTTIFQFLCCGVLLAPIGSVFGQGIQFLQDEPLEKVLILAKQQNKIIFIDGYTKTCAPCKELDRKVFPLQEVGNYFNSNFINVKYDLEEPEGEKVRARYKDVITGFPSLILLDKDGKMIHKIGGYHEPDSLINKMKAALNGISLSAMRSRLQAGEKSVAFMQDYKKIMDDGFLRGESEAVSMKMADRLKDEELLDPKMWQLIGGAVTDPYSAVFSRVVKNYWIFWQHKTTDLGILEFQLRTAIQNATDEIVKPEEKDNKIILKREPKKEAILLDYLNNADRFKHTETIKALFYVHDLALAGQWSDLVTALKFYHQIGAIGNSTTYMYLHIQYMMQFCKDKKVLLAAAKVLTSLPKVKLDVMDYNDNYSTLIKLYTLVGNKHAADKYKELQLHNRNHGI